MKNYIRIAVRENIYFDSLLNCLTSLSNLLIENKFNKMYINIHSNIISEFNYIDTEILLPHENYITERHNKLFDYINSITGAIPSMDRSSSSDRRFFCEGASRSKEMLPAGP